jgi:hypothetical protein
MEQWEIPLSPGIDPADAETVIEECCLSLGLIQGLKGTLKTCPGSVHWHLTRPQQRGVLEVTFWPQAHRLWLAAHKGRQAPWIRVAAPRLREAIQGALGSHRAMCPEEDVM